MAVEIVCMLYAIEDREAMLESLEQANKPNSSNQKADKLASSGDASKGANLFKVSDTILGFSNFWRC